MCKIKTISLCHLIFQAVWQFSLSIFFIGSLNDLNIWETEYFPWYNDNMVYHSLCMHVVCDRGAISSQIVNWEIKHLVIHASQLQCIAKNPSVEKMHNFPIMAHSRMVFFSFFYPLKKVFLPSEDTVVNGHCCQYQPMPTVLNKSQISKQNSIWQ